MTSDSDERAGECGAPRAVTQASPAERQSESPERGRATLRACLRGDLAAELGLREQGAEPEEREDDEKRQQEGGQRNGMVVGPGGEQAEHESIGEFLDRSGVVLEPGL